MKKQEIIDYLEKNNIEYDKDMKYFSLLKFYNDVARVHLLYEKEKQERELYEKEKQERETIDERGKILKSIIEFMPTIANKTKGTRSEIDKMFRLHNLYFKSRENPSCSQCVSNVFNRLMNLYKKHK